MKNNLLVLVFALAFNLSNAQEVLLNDYSQNEIGKYDDSNKYEELYLSTYTKQNEGKAYEGILIKGKKGYASSSRPYIKIPIELVPEFQTFLINGREKYYEWAQVAKDKNITDMKKSIAVFPHKLYMLGDDYGYVSGMTDAKLEFDLEDGYPKMLLKCYINDGVRSDLLYLYLLKNNEKWRDLGLLRLIEDMTTEKVQAEIDEINNSADLFKN